MLHSLVLNCSESCWIYIYSERNSFSLCRCLDLQQSDSGLYTCKAVSETGETTWTASLAVEPTTNLHIIFHPNHNLNTFPGPPSKPVVSDIAETTMRLTWRANQNTGASAVVCYIVEYFSHETGEVSHHRRFEWFHCHMVL